MRCQSKDCLYCTWGVISLSYEDLKLFEEIAKEQGAEIIERIYTDQIVMDFRATYKCRTCLKFGKKPTCPPNIPNFDYFTKLINSYKYGLLVGKSYQYIGSAEFKKIRGESGPRVQEILLTLEHQAFNRNYYWAISFIGGSCRGCNACPPESKICVTPSRGRIPLEATGVNVIETCLKKGIEISPFPHPANNSKLFRVGLFLLE
jgi:predicted metal-binding protein